MRDMLTLMHVQVLGLLNSFAPNAQGMPRAARARRLVFVALLALLLVTVFAGYTALMAIGLAVSGMANVIPPFAVAAGSLAGVFFTFMKARGTLFGTRDYDLIMSLPVPRRTVVIARMATLFGSAIAVAAIFMVPMYAVYLVMTGANAVSIVLAALSVVLAPLAPTALATFAAFAVTALAARFRHAGIVYITLALLAMLAFVMGAYGFSFTAGVDHEATVAATLQVATVLESAITSAYPPAAWAAAGIASHDVLSFALFATASIGVTAACVEVMQRFYLRINGMLAGRRRRARGRAAVGARRTPFTAIVVKEFRTLLGIPSYAFNCLFGYLLMVAIAIVLSVMGLRGILMSGAIDGIDQDTLAHMGNRIYLVIPWVFAFCASTGASSTISVSLEGRCAWIMASAPLSVRTILWSKLASNLIPVGCSLVLSTVILLVSGQIEPLIAIELLIVSLGLFHLWANVGIAIDAARPNFSWTSANEIVKRSMPITVSVIGGMVCEFGFGALCVALIPDMASIAAAHATAIGVGVVAAILGQLLFMRTARTARLYIV
ncbi:hypothetical protein H6A35_11045 [Collinsella tanakaei]|uniref:hypothetical protein n=1 Tax=Collinsella sp. An271 TaxID=1965616 RepID=UPI00117FB942|nr:hypothetical protein [Collinsella sp. An271]MBM6689391.1 hypothetical protein [Collinsella tanakaei]